MTSYPRAARPLAIMTMKALNWFAPAPCPSTTVTPDRFAFDARYRSAVTLSRSSMVIVSVSGSIALSRVFAKQRLDNIQGAARLSIARRAAPQRERIWLLHQFATWSERATVAKELFVTEPRAVEPV